MNKKLLLCFGLLFWSMVAAATQFNCLLLDQTSLGKKSQAPQPIRSESCRAIVDAGSNPAFEQSFPKSTFNILVIRSNSPGEELIVGTFAAKSEDQQQFQGATNASQFSISEKTMKSKNLGPKPKELADTDGYDAAAMINSLQRFTAAAMKPSEKRQ
jgi:hypothetical protein